MTIKSQLHLIEYLEQKRLEAEKRAFHRRVAASERRHALARRFIVAGVVLLYGGLLALPHSPVRCLAVMALGALAITLAYAIRNSIRESGWEYDLQKKRWRFK